MSKLFGRLVIVALALLAPVHPGQAGVLDHMMCYRVRDPLKIAHAVDMITDLQPEFSQKGCVLIKPLEFCVPATKTNVEPPADNPNIGGQALHNDYVCYLAKCAKDVGPASKNVIDQFGTRVQKKYKPRKICVPAYKAPVECGAAGARQCAGACPEGQICQNAPTDGCECTPTECGGKPDSTGMCGGTCPTAGDICQPALSADGNKICACNPPPPPPCGVNDTTGTCGGTCPNATDKCVVDAAGECSCQPAYTPCEREPGTGMCVGVCPDPTEQCVSDPTLGCICQTPPCDRNAVTGTCGGFCPTPENCGLIPGTNICGCQ